MHKSTVTLFSEPQAPKKPALGAPCNGCGVCCLLEPCPLGRLLLGSVSGQCPALRWQATTHVYRCGVITDAAEILRHRWPDFLAPAVPPLAWLLKRLAPRWVAAGAGCDCEVQCLVQPPPNGAVR